MNSRSAMAMTALFGLLASCAPGPRIDVSQPVALRDGPRVIVLPQAEDEDVPAPAIPVVDMERAVQAAGFTLDAATRPTYRLYLSTGTAPFRAGSMAVAGGKGVAPIWVTAPDRRVAVRIAGRRIVHVTVALVDIKSGALVWRGTAYRPVGPNPAATANALTLTLLDRLPRS